MGYSWVEFVGELGQKYLTQRHGVQIWWVGSPSIETRFFKVPIDLTQEVSKVTTAASSHI